MSEQSSRSRDDAVEQPGTAAQTISNAVVQVLRAYAGRGPREADALIAPEIVVVTLRDCLTTGERTLVESGSDELVKEVRAVMHEGIRPELTTLVEEVTGATVYAYLADQHLEPDVAVLSFVLTPPDEGHWDVTATDAPSRIDRSSRAPRAV